ncbi:hypothetical protein DCO57_22780 [Labrenzia sp. 011]|nr:hypothetical protein DCO57_22780 [Labrenzia sp. 011]
MFQAAAITSAGARLSPGRRPKPSFGKSHISCLEVDAARLIFHFEKRTEGNGMVLPDDEAPALKWPTRKARRAACEALCAHIAAGYSLDSFPGANRTTIRYYVEQFPNDFPPAKLEEAERLGLLEWERIGKEGAKGDLAKFNASAWTFTMKNRAGWQDRPEADARGSPCTGDGIVRAETFKPRSSEEIALGVLALLTAKDMPEDGDGSQDAD